ncbi:MAG: metalloregulator ArsR/SmtB family transcription factor [Pseudomonadota bacterium]
MKKIPLPEMKSNAANAEKLLSLLANRHRLLVLCHLIEKERTVTQLLDDIAISQSALSQHLAKLREAKLVATEREGQSIRYRIASQEARKLIETLCDLYA